MYYFLDSGYVIFSLLVILVWIIIAAAVASKMQSIAEEKGSKERYWAWCFWLGPVGYLMVLALPDYVAREKLENIREEVKTASWNSSTSKSDKYQEDMLPDL